MDRISKLSPRDQEQMEQLKQKSGGNRGFTLFKVLRYYHKSEGYKNAHGRYLMEELVQYENGVVKDQIIGFMKDAVKFFHKGLDLDSQEKKRQRFEDYVRERFRYLEDK